jgi:hypothetical protein
MGVLRIEFVTVQDRRIDLYDERRSKHADSIRQDFLLRHLLLFCPPCYQSVLSQLIFGGKDIGWVTFPEGIR